jgi:RNA polymerase sigma-54 factor
MLSQKLSQKLLQKLSPQQIQLMKLLQIPTANLEQRIKEELEINPALEESFEDYDHPHEDINEPQELGESEEDYMGNESADSDDIDLSDYMQEDTRYDFKDEPDEFADEDRKTYPHAVGKSFHDYLNEQLHLQELDEREYQIADQLVGTIDDDGYIRRELDAIVDDLSFSRGIMVAEIEVRDVLTIIQRFDPPGVGARSLQECLLLQLHRKEHTPYTDLAIKVIESNFDAFTKKHYDRLKRSLNIDEDVLKEVLDEILKLNPKPGGTSDIASVNQQVIIPDFTVENSNGLLDVFLNGKNAPDLRISESFKDMMQDYTKSKVKDKKQKEAILFIKQKIDSAKWFIDAIKQRQHTLLSTMNAIVGYQKEYFLSGDESKLKPMILKDIAEITGLDISTVSRVANSKYAQTEFGIYALKYFFSEGLQTDSGEEVSTREVKRILSELIGGEDKSKPLSDEQLTDLLKEKGYNIARRTVAKYREQMDIPVARLRKSL